MAILVLGGAGYIGSHMVDRLVEKGQEKVIVVDSLVTGHRAAVHPDAIFYQGDLSDQDFMRKVFKENPDVDAVIHFAAYSLEMCIRDRARDISLGFLPYSLLASFVLSLIASYLYARLISAPILEIKQMTKRMKRLDRTASLPIHSQDEIGVLKQQINDLYHHLLEVIDNLEQQKQENLKLEQMKVEFLRGASHELKTPLASLKIILENMRDKIGRYKDRDRYLLVSLDIVDEMNQIVLEILSLSSVQELGGDKEWIQLDDVVNRILTQNQVLVENRSLLIDNYLPATSIFMNLPILKLVLSNIISNAVKHSDKGGVIRIGLENEGTDFVIENTSVSKENISTKAQSKKEGGLGLFVVKYLLEHEELSYRFEESSTGRRFVMVLPKK